MRGALAFCLCLWAVFALGQEGSENLFQTVRPDLMLVIRSQAGVDVIEVTTLTAGYPEDHLRAQISELAKLVGSEVRGLILEKHNPIPENPQTEALLAKFAVVGLVKREQSVLGLEPIARAFAVHPGDERANALTVQYAADVPTTDILKNYSSPAVQVQGGADPEFGIEYRIMLISKNPAEIEIPEGAEAREAQQKPAEKEPESGPDWLIIGIVAIAALAVGALVYSLLLRPRSGTTSR